MKKPSKYQANATAEDLIDLAAKRAAQEAAQFHAQQLKQAESGLGAFAMYAWAFFAFVASGIAGGTAYINSMDQQPPFITAALKPAQPTVTLPKTDPITTAALRPASDPEILKPKPTLSAFTAVKPTPSQLGVLYGGFMELDSVFNVYETAQSNHELDMAGNEPLVRFSQVGTEFRAGLILGPFESVAAVAEFCAKTDVACEVASYSGDQLFAE